MTATRWQGTCCVLGIVVLLLCITQAQAGPIFEVTEALLQTQAAEAGLIGRSFGPDSSSPLTFTSSEDFTNRRFSFAVLSISKYLGHHISLTGSGALNGTTGRYEWSTTGMLGSTALDGTGTITFSASGSNGRGSWTKTPIGQGEKDWETSTVDKNLNTTTTIGWTRNGKPDGTTTTTADDSQFPGVIDYPWSWDEHPATVDGFTFAVESSGVLSPADGSGTFQTKISSVPEPSTLTLLGLAVLSMAGYVWKRRKSIS